MTSRHDPQARSPAAPRPVSSPSSVGRYRLLLGYARRDRRGWALIVTVTLLSTVFGLVQPLPLKVVVDNVVGDNPAGALLDRLPGAGADEGLLAWMVLAGLLVFALSSTFDVVLTFLWIKIGQGMVYALARDLFARLQRRSLLFHSRTPVGESLERVTGDSWAVHTVVDTLLFAPLHATLVTVGILIVMTRMDPWLTAAAFAVAPFMVASSIAFGRPVRRASEMKRRVQGLINAHVQQTLAGIPVVQAYLGEDRSDRRFRNLATEAIRSDKQVALAGALNGLGSGFVTSLGNGLVLFLGARLVLDDRMSVGDLLAFVAYLGMLQAQLRNFTGIYTALQSARAGIDRVLDVLADTDPVTDAPGRAHIDRVHGHIRIEHVTFSYDGPPVLDDVSFEARPGEKVAIVGSTGAGKSTLVSLVPRFFDPSSGRVLIDGHDVRDLDLDSLRRHIAIVLQEPFLLPTSVAENISYGRPGATAEDVEAAARAANADEFIRRLPQGFDTVLGERGATLSGGERQRIAIARALLKDAPVLILDEPTSALDAETEHLLLAAIRRLMAGRTTFVIAHRLSTVRDADRIVVVEGGRVVEIGTHEGLLAEGGRYAHLHRLQTANQRELVL